MEIKTNNKRPSDLEIRKHSLQLCAGKDCTNYIQPLNEVDIGVGILQDYGCGLCEDCVRDGVEPENDEFLSELFGEM